MSYMREFIEWIPRVYEYYILLELFFSLIFMLFSNKRFSL